MQQLDRARREAEVHPLSDAPRSLRPNFVQILRCQKLFPERVAGRLHIDLTVFRARDRDNCRRWPFELDHVLAGVVVRHDGLNLGNVGNGGDGGNLIGGDEFQLRDVLRIDSHSEPAMLIQKALLETLLAGRDDDGVEFSVL